MHPLIRRLLNQALKWRWIMVNPAVNASPPRVDRPELEIPNVEVVTQIINFAEERSPDIACFLRLAAVTGARREELCAVRWRDNVYAHALESSDIDAAHLLGRILDDQGKL